MHYWFEDIENSPDATSGLIDRVPFLADLKPSGQYVMADLHDVGGTPAVMKYLLEEGYLDGDCLTVTGRTLAENLQDLPGLREGQDVIHPIDQIYEGYAKELVRSGLTRRLVPANGDA